MPPGQELVLFAGPRLDFQRGAGDLGDAHRRAGGQIRSLDAPGAVVNLHPPPSARDGAIEDKIPAHILRPAPVQVGMVGGQGRRFK